MQTTLRRAPQDRDCDREGTDVEVLGCEFCCTGGADLIFADATNSDELIAALEILRGFEVAGRRVVVCDATSFDHSRKMAFHELGREFVSRGQANLVITFGRGRHEVALAARDAGLATADVIACCDASSAGDVVLERLAPGDTALLLGIQERQSKALEERLVGRDESIAR